MNLECCHGYQIKVKGDCVKNVWGVSADYLLKELRNKVVDFTVYTQQSLIS